MSADTARADANGWMPIETAPKDGTPFLASCTKTEAGSVKMMGHQAVDKWHVRKHDGYDGLGKFNATYWPATHWQPLPAPPIPHSETAEARGK